MTARRFSLTLSALGVCTLFTTVDLQAQAPPAATPAAKKWTPPRTPWGEPDLQGTFSNRTITPFERPSNVGGLEFFTAEEVAALEKGAQDLRVEISDLAKAQVRAAEQWWRQNRLKAPNAIREELERAAVLISI